MYQILWDLAYVAGARKGRERELLSFLPRAPKFPLPLLNACHAGYLGPESKMGRDSERDAGCGMPKYRIARKFWSG